jgi:ribosome biogenesis GTPase
MAKKKKVRVELRKNRTKPPRERDWTEEKAEKRRRTEQVRPKGDLSRRRTIIQDESAEASDSKAAEMPAVDIQACVPGRILRVHGLQSHVATDDGRVIRCTASSRARRRGANTFSPPTSIRWSLSCRSWSRT